MQKNKINYSMLEEEFIKYVHKTYRIDLSIQNLNLRPIDIGMDSLDAVEMLLWAEEKFGIKTENSDYSETRPMLEFLELVYSRIPKSKKI
jgi:acyl carrier protein